MENQSRLLPFPTLPNFRGGPHRPGAENFAPTISFKHQPLHRTSSLVGAPFAGPRPPPFTPRGVTRPNGPFPRAGHSPALNNNSNVNNNNNNNHNKNFVQKSLSNPVPEGTYHTSKAQINDQNPMTSTTNNLADSFNLSATRSNNHNLIQVQTENHFNDTKNHYDKHALPYYSVANNYNDHINTAERDISGPFSPQCLVGGVVDPPNFHPLPPPPPPGRQSPSKSASGADAVYSRPALTTASHVNATQIEELVRSLTSYFDAVKLCYAANISVAQTFSTILGADDSKSPNAQVAGRFLAFSREAGARVIDDAQREKDTTAAQLVKLVAQLTAAAAEDEEDETTADITDGERARDLQRKVVCQSFCSLMHFHNKLANLSNIANFDSNLRSVDRSRQNTNFPIFSTAGPLKNTSLSPKPFRMRSNGDALDLVLDMLSAGLTPAFAPPPTDVPSTSQRMGHSPFDQTSKPQLTQPPSTLPSRFHTLPHPPSSTTTAPLLNHIVSQSQLPSHSSLPRNFMPQSNTNNNNNNPMSPRSGPLPSTHSTVSASGVAQVQSPARSASGNRMLSAPAVHPALANMINDVDNYDVYNRDDESGLDGMAPYPSRPPPPRGGTWPNSIPRDAGSAGSAGFLSSDSSLSRDSWAGSRAGNAVLPDQQKPFDNPSMEKEYLNYIASVKQYLNNQQQNNQNYSERVRSHPFGVSSNYSDSSSSSSLLSPSNSIWSRRPDEVIDELAPPDNASRARANSLDILSILGGGCVVGDDNAIPGGVSDSTAMNYPHQSSLLTQDRNEMCNGVIPSPTALVNSVLTSPTEQLANIMRNMELEACLAASGTPRSDAALSPGFLDNALFATQAGGKDQESLILEKTKTWPPPRSPWGVVNVLPATSDEENSKMSSVGEPLKQSVWIGSKNIF